MKDPWLVDIKGSHRGGEIALVKKSFEHGFLSYGWEGKDKIIVHSVHTLYNKKGTNKEVWKFAVKQAHIEAVKLNKEN